MTSEINYCGTQVIKGDMIAVMDCFSLEECKCLYPDLGGSDFELPPDSGCECANMIAGVQRGATEGEEPGKIKCPANKKTNGSQNKPQIDSQNGGRWQRNAVSNFACTPECPSDTEGTNELLKFDLPFYNQTDCTDHEANDGEIDRFITDAICDTTSVESPPESCFGQTRL